MMSLGVGAGLSRPQRWQGCLWCLHVNHRMHGGRENRAPRYDACDGGYHGDAIASIACAQPPAKHVVESRDVKKESMMRVVETRVYRGPSSYGEPGGFLRRLSEQNAEGTRGTWLGHVAEHVALEIQCLAGTPVSYGKT